ncbi:MAG: hypothetical protein AAGK28_14380, partial [Pseudomonadota bacterium]
MSGPFGPIREAGKQVGSVRYVWPAFGTQRLAACRAAAGSAAARVVLSRCALGGGCDAEIDQIAVVLGRD